MRITDLEFHDVRFPTSEGSHGSDATHRNPDYSAAYVILRTDNPSMNGFGLSFTLGRGTEVVISAMEALKPFIINKTLSSITNNFGQFWHEFNNEDQLRWLGPEKGVIHLAASGIINAVWDLWARTENKPLWRLLTDMSNEQLLSCIDFSYISDVLTKNDAEKLLSSDEERKTRVEWLSKQGYPAYTTSAGWIGYSSEEVRRRCYEYKEKGFQAFKVKVGIDKNEDLARLKEIREIIGPETPMMTDANQRWNVDEAIDWMKHLSEVRPYWIEEPTSCDDIIGHATIAKELNPLGILVATGEHGHNRVMFKQFLSTGGMQICQVDCCRLGSVNEVLAVLLLAAKYKVPVCPHAGGVGLCEYVQHVVVVDYVCLTGSTEGRMCEYADHLHEHFVEELGFKNGRYFPPISAGYSVEMKESSIQQYSFPSGNYWRSKIEEID